MQKLFNRNFYIHYTAPPKIVFQIGLESYRKILIHKRVSESD